ncbi:MAG TPA: hypothetical protein VFS21_05445 [Roseiflexaceae bacterium]|nr:hypothetical protein [Roseiflexaceae bacterium]
MLRTAPWQRASALAVHLYTASGAVLALLIVQAAVQGNAVQALWFGLIAMIIDGTDGTLARRFRVRETLPWFDGARLDDIVDYLTYVFAPVMLLLSGGYLPEGPGGMVLAALPLLASSYQFCRVDAKTDDHFFLGFPSYWNVVAFYAITQQWSPTLTTVVLVVCSVLVFVPIRYLYPSRTVAFRKLTLAVSGLWLLCYALILLQMPQPNPLLLNVSILFVVYYVGMSLYLTLKRK